MACETRIEKLNLELAALSETPHCAKLLEEHNAFQTKKRRTIKKAELMEMMAFSHPPAAVAECLTLVYFVIKKKFGAWTEVKPTAKSKDFLSALECSELSEEQYC